MTAGERDRILSGPVSFMPSETERSLREVLLDDETVSRAGLIAILEEDSSIVVAAATVTQVQALHAMGQNAPDVVVASGEYWHEGIGSDAVKEFVSAVQVPVLLVTTNVSAQIVREARSAATAGLISRRGSARAIRGAVHAAAAGASVFPRLPKGHRAKLPSGRERQIIARVADGRTNDEIAGALGLSGRTIASHLRRCLVRYGVASRTELAMLAVREQVVCGACVGVGYSAVPAACERPQRKGVSGPVRYDPAQPNTPPGPGFVGGRSRPGPHRLEG